MILLVIAIILISLGVMPYLVYFVGISLNKQQKRPVLSSEYPDISIIIPAYNEERVIEKRILNILKTDYPQDKYEVILIDDCSDDDTGIIAERIFSENGISHCIITNVKRMGTNKSFNLGIARAKNDLIVTTGADVFFEKDALNSVISRLLSDNRIATVCADMLPSDDSSDTEPGRMESVYRSYYGRMCNWESFIDSTYNFNGGLVAFKRSIFDKINERKGADDANTAFEAIRRGYRAVYEINAVRRGYRAVYEINAVVYEDIPKNLSHQYRQKIRRATRLIEATLSNLDLLKQKRQFSRIFYPLRIMMFILTPSLLISGTGIFLLWLLLQNIIYGMVLIAVLIIILGMKNNVLSSFVYYQFYLFIGLMQLGSDMRLWESTSGKN